jgi:hypothetical protein
MKIKIGRKTIDIFDKHIKSFKSKDDFVKSMLKDLEEVHSDNNILSTKLSEVYDLVVPPKAEAPKKAAANN